ncbi:hypothetical protein D4Q76_02885, partial [archaeon]
MVSAKQLRILTISIYGILTAFIVALSLVGIYYSPGKIVDYLINIGIYVSFFVLYYHGSKQGSQYLEKVAKELDAHADFVLPSLFFLLIDIFILAFFLLLIPAAYFLTYNLAITLSVAFVSILVVSILSFFNPIFDAVKIASQIKMFEQSERGDDPKLFKALRESLEDKNMIPYALETLSLGIISSLIAVASIKLEIIYNKLFFRPMTFLIAIYAFYEKDNIIDSTNSALKTLRKNFTESFYGSETSWLGNISFYLPFGFLGITAYLQIQARTLSFASFFSPLNIFVFIILMILSTYIYVTFNSFGALYFIYLYKNRENAEKKDMSAVSAFIRKILKSKPKYGTDYDMKLENEKDAAVAVNNIFDMIDNKISEARQKSNTEEKKLSRM